MSILNRFFDHLRSAWPTIRVVVTFIVTITAAFTVMTYEPIVQRFDVAWLLAQASAWASWLLLRGVGAVADFPVLLQGTNLVSDEFRVDVSPACSGAVASMIYLAAVFAYPTTLRAKLIGTALGIVIIQGLNLIRIVVLFLIGLFANEYFHDTHVYVTQALVVAVAIATWMYWAGRFANAPGR